MSVPESVSEKLRQERLGALHASCLDLAKRQERENYTQLVACRCDDPALLRIIRGFVFEPGKEPSDYTEGERDRRARLNIAVWSGAGSSAGFLLHDLFQDRLRKLGGPMKAKLIPDMQLVIDDEPWFGVVLGDKRSFARVAADAAELTTPRQTDPPDFFPWRHTYVQCDWLETLIRVVGVNCERFGLANQDPAVLSLAGESTFDVVWLPYDLFTASAKAIETLMKSERTREDNAPPDKSFRSKQKVLKLLEKLAEKPGAKFKGLVLARTIEITESTFRKYYAPTLKQRGVRNDGDGYYLPAEPSEDSAM